MLKRKTMRELAGWKNRPDKMCLVLEGARQVGKTYIVEKNSHASITSITSPAGKIGNNSPNKLVATRRTCWT